ncbi:hypothetical protein NDU88_001298 [Pleurodeles waltl]|uniref:Uncharacterized protein n=1 Tax=Pleurodeles waltl TaxID=8319 RepID=A0AAV7NC73_PLEWA|nr:hypothetical protein NDU88_001298 [Pleurodeles waltl]
MYQGRNRDLGVAYAPFVPSLTGVPSSACTLCVSALHQLFTGDLWGRAAAVAHTASELFSCRESNLILQVNRQLRPWLARDVRCRARAGNQKRWSEGGVAPASLCATSCRRAGNSAPGVCAVAQNQPAPLYSPP